MAESLYDTTKEKPRLDFEAQMKERDALLKQIKTDEAQAVQILTDNRCGKLAPAAPGATTSEAPAAPADHAVALKESAAEVRTLVTKLDGLILPRAGGGAMPFVWSVAGIAIGGTVGMWLAKWQPDIPMIGTGAGVGLAVGIIIAIILFVQARKAAALVTAPLALAIGRSRTTAEAWQLHASTVRKALEEEHASKRDKEVEVARIKVQKVKEEATRTGNERMLALRQSRPPTTPEASLTHQSSSL